MNGRLYDPLLRRFLNADENIQDPYNTQNYNKYGYVLNNPLIYTDPNGEWFGIDDLIVSGISFVIGYIGHGFDSGNWGWEAVKAGAQASVAGWISYNTLGLSIVGGKAISGVSGSSMWNFLTNSAIDTAISCVVPPLQIQIGNFDFNFSPSIAMGKGWGFGANVSATFHAGDFSMSYGFGLMSYGFHAATGESGLQMRKSVMANYYSKDFSIGLGTNFWSGMYAQQTGIISIGSGDFSITYENDGSPFDKIGPGILGDGHDRWRTAAMTINVGEFHSGFNLFTGERTSDSYKADLGTMKKCNKDHPCYINGIKYTFGLVDEKGPRYRLGAAYVGWDNYRIGIDSDHHVRYPIQNILAHEYLSPQPGFKVLSPGIKEYFQYQTRNKFTSW